MVRKQRLLVRKWLEVVRGEVDLVCKKRDGADLHAMHGRKHHDGSDIRGLLPDMLRWCVGWVPRIVVRRRS